MLPVYAELHCLSNFTFLRGASHPEELVERAFVLGYDAIAITDECSVAGVVRAHTAVKTLNEKNKEQHKAPFKLIVGTEVMLEDGLRLVLLATDRAGYGAMCALITRARMRTAKGKYRLERADFDAGVPGCLALLVPGAFPEVPDARFVAERFPGSAWIAAELVYGVNDAARLAALRELAKTAGLPLADRKS